MMQPEVAMATDFLAEAVEEACDGAAIEIANNFPFLSKLSRLSEVLHCGLPLPPQNKGPMHWNAQRLHFPGIFSDSLLHRGAGRPSRKMRRARSLLLLFCQREECLR